MGSFFSFDRMITPTIIKIVFWIGLVLSILVGLILLIAGGSSGARLVGLIYLLIGPLLWRIYCEILIVIFKMHESLVAIERNTAPGPMGAAHRDEPGPTPA